MDCFTPKSFLQNWRWTVSTDDALLNPQTSLPKFNIGETNLSSSNTSDGVSDVKLKRYLFNVKPLSVLGQLRFSVPQNTNPQM